MNRRVVANYTKLWYTLAINKGGRCYDWTQGGVKTAESGV